MLIPKEVKSVVFELQKNGFEAFVVGGCVRDILLKKSPNDWDVATNAKPEQIQKIFPDSFYENRFFTVSVQTKSKKEDLKEIEVTTYRFESQYADQRHPDSVEFAKDLKEDLSRRDFTINAMALDINEKQKTKKEKLEIIDPFEGQKDLKLKLIRAVGDPSKRFSEDALRMMRAVRLAVRLGFSIEEKTSKAIKENSDSLKIVSSERIRDELIKIIESENAGQGIETLRELNLLKHIIPELEQGYKVGQNKHHVYDCYEHSLKSLEYTVKKNFNTYVRMAALLHDVGKPATKRGEGKESTFYGHEVVGAKMTKKILERLKFSKKDIEKITKLVRYHLFYYHPDEVNESSVRRLLCNIGKESIEELIQLRMADRIGSGCPKAEPYKLRHLRYIIEKVSNDPISAKMLKMNGNDIIKILKIKPGPKIGQILDILLGEVLEDPKKNKKIDLEKEVKRLGQLSDSDLIKLSTKAKNEKEKLEIKKDEMVKQKYWVS
jgi:poly(A) polymerase/tRNA nucleotidyltransferase (CCA-adding enzyme)